MFYNFKAGKNAFLGCMISFILQIAAKKVIGFGHIGHVYEYSFTLSYFKLMCQGSVLEKCSHLVSISGWLCFKN